MATPKTFIGQLNQNSVLSTMYNMIISQEVFSDNISLKGTLVEKFRVDGTLFGDTKLFTSTDIGHLTDFPNSSETVLTKRNPKDPKIQAVTIDTFKQTAVTVDGVRLKQAFPNADLYGLFVGVIVQWLRETYKVLNVTLINTYVGTEESLATRSEVLVELPEVPSLGIVERRAHYNLVAELVGESLANLVVDMNDALRDFNDYGFLRAYNTNDFMIVWNKRWINKMKRVALPNIFHKGDTLALDMEFVTINDRFFGKKAEYDGDKPYGTYRLLEPIAYTITSTDKTAGHFKGYSLGEVIQLFPGDLLPVGHDGEDVELYEVDEDIICKVVHKRAIPFMSAMLVGSEFYNPKDLDRTHFLTWGYSKPQYLANLPLITVRASTEE